jgi:hypothetical protein
MDLPVKESVFDVDHVGEITGKRYEGSFTVRCVLNMAQKHALELEKTRLLGNHSSPTDGLVGIAVVLANLRAKIVDAPEWWKQSAGGYDILDEDVLVTLYGKIQDAETAWREKLREKVVKQQEASQQSTRSGQ